MMFDAGKKQAQSAKKSGQWRDDDLANIEFARQTSSVYGTGTTKGQQSEVTRVTTPLGGDFAQRAHGARIGDAVDAPGRRQ